MKMFAHKTAFRTKADTIPRPNKYFVLSVRYIFAMKQQVKLGYDFSRKLNEM